MTWGIAGRRAQDAGEGTPKRWRDAGLHSLAGVAPPLVEPIALGVLYPATHLRHFDRYVAQPCIGRSGGKASELPVSAVWEVLIPLAFAAQWCAEAEIRVNLFEEQLQQPKAASGLAEVAEFTCAFAEKFGALINVPVTTYITNAPPAEMAAYSPEALYGLFTPFGNSRYPLGFPNSERILTAFGWYVDRYREIADQREDVCIVEGVHMVDAIKLALGDSPECYCAVVPLPDPGMPGRLAQDSPFHQRWNIRHFHNLRPDWWPIKDLSRLFDMGSPEKLISAIHRIIARKVIAYA